MSARNALIVDVDYSSRALPSAGCDLPSQQTTQEWIDRVFSCAEVRDAAIALADEAVERYHVSVHLASADDIQVLNRDYRSSDRATNVLSFPAELPPLDGRLTLGEVVLCPEVIDREAFEQKKPVIHHWEHMVVHGVLHLLGYDHLEDVDAERMEALEIRLLSESGISDPYRGTAPHLHD